jgi:hypothetical protein
MQVVILASGTTAAAAAAAAATTASGLSAMRKNILAHEWREEQAGFCWQVARSYQQSQCVLAQRHRHLEQREESLTGGGQVAHLQAVPRGFGRVQRCRCTQPPYTRSADRHYFQH